MSVRVILDSVIDKSQRDIISKGLPVINLIGLDSYDFFEIITRLQENKYNHLGLFKVDNFYVCTPIDKVSKNIKLITIR